MSLHRHGEYMWINGGSHTKWIVLLGLVFASAYFFNVNEKQRWDSIKRMTELIDCVIFSE